jgi:hypothetical protein
MTKRITKEEHQIQKALRVPKTEFVTVNGYSAEITNSGDILCTYVCFRPVNFKELMVVIGEAAKKDTISAVVNVSNTKEQTERAVRFTIKKGEHHIQIPFDEQSLKRKDKIAVSIEYSGEAPKDVWVAAFGEMLI